MKHSTSAFLVAVALVIGGCASSDNSVMATADQATIAKRIVNGKTTQREVQDYLGSPDDVRYTDSGQEIWQYVHHNTSVNATTFIPVVGIFAGGSKTDQKLLTILFDKKGVVVKSTYAANSKEYHNSIK